MQMTARRVKFKTAVKTCENFTTHPRKWSRNMLVLTRKKGETIQIGDSVVIKVIACGRGKVKIGVDAPATTRVLRGEIMASLERPVMTPQAAPPIRLAR
jgi:carbon storage regulator